jgi:hypothetical protein
MTAEIRWRQWTPGQWTAPPGTRPPVTVADLHPVLDAVVARYFEEQQVREQMRDLYGGPDVVVRTRRLDGEWWETRVTPR